MERFQMAPGDDSRARDCLLLKHGQRQSTHEETLNDLRNYDLAAPNLKTLEVRVGKPGVESRRVSLKTED